DAVNRLFLGDILMYRRKLISTLMITSLLAMMGFAGVLLVMINTINMLLFVVLLFVAAFLITVRIMEWVGDERYRENKSHHKVEKVLRELDDHDLELLRSRLMQD